MSFLQAAKKPVAKAPMITIVGSPGTGKTTLGALFPDAIFIQTEDGSAVFENWAEDAQPTLLQRIPKAYKEGIEVKNDSKAYVLAMIDELITADHSYKTLVIDSITTLNLLFEHLICVRDDVGTVGEAAGGFHKGYGEVASWHADIIYKCEQLRAVKNMAVIFLAHTGIKKIRNRPDAAADYSVFSMDMPTDSLSVYTSQSDAVLYLRNEELVMGSESNKKGQTTKYGRVTSTGNRQLVTAGDGQTGYVNAKNRYNMPAVLDVPHGENPTLQYIKFFNKGE